MARRIKEAVRIKNSITANLSALWREDRRSSRITNAKKLS
jgi:hypothetical protein